jgi:hypothetical protein
MWMRTFYCQRSCSTVKGGVFPALVPESISGLSRSITARALGWPSDSPFESVANNLLPSDICAPAVRLEPTTKRLTPSRSS